MSQNGKKCPKVAKKVPLLGRGPGPRPSPSPISGKKAKGWKKDKNEEKTTKPQTNYSGQKSNRSKIK